MTAQSEIPEGREFRATWRRVPLRERLRIMRLSNRGLTAEDDRRARLTAARARWQLQHPAQRITALVCGITVGSIVGAVITSSLDNFFFDVLLPFISAGIAAPPVELYRRRRFRAAEEANIEMLDRWQNPRP